MLPGANSVTHSPEMRLIGVSGLAGSGKDAVASILVSERQFCRVALADPLKRACADWFGWSHEQLWGPSELRNVEDFNWDGLTPRKALQTLGTNWGRAMHPDVWVRQALFVFQQLSTRGSYSYTPERGLVYPNGNGHRFAGVVIPDTRYPNELAAIRAAGGTVWRIVRPGAGLTGEAGAHASETSVRDEDCDLVIVNDGSLDDLKRKVLEVCR